MPLRIEDYALIGDCQTAALVGRDGSLDWLCFPRFDSPACFAPLLGTPDHGRWLLAPAGEVRRVRRRYRDDTLVLETEFEPDDGVATLIDCMPPRGRRPDLVRVVHGKRGQVCIRMELIMRFDYGSSVPWVRREQGGLRAIAGPDTLRLRTPVALPGENFTTVAEFTVARGERVPFVLTWHPSHEPPPAPIDGLMAVRQTERWWRQWSDRCTYLGGWHEAVLRSLITLKVLTYSPTGGIVATATTSLPEQLGGVRNLDYRFCWLRDATFTLYALAGAGYHDEARDWREWLLRAVAGKPSQLQILYGLAGERRLTELTLDWLPGYEGARPVRIGNAASNQFQLDVYGEVLDMRYQCNRADMGSQDDDWRLQRSLMNFLDEHWQEPDKGIWEVRGPRRHFTHSKMMAWVAVDRGVKAVERFGVDGPLDRWTALWQAIHEEVCRQGSNADLGAFVQYYGADRLDASLRYAHAPDVDSLPPGEGAFLPCTFWLADNLALLGRHDEARRIFERLLGLRNDVGLLAEEYDPRARRLVGNFPQAFSHIGLVNTARNLTTTEGPAEHRKES